MSISVQLLQRRTGHIVKAELLAEQEIDLEIQHAQWSEWMGCYRRLGDAGDAYWDWRSFLEAERQASVNVTCYGLTANGLFQGLMITGETEDSNLTGKSGERLLYVN